MVTRPWEPTEEERAAIQGFQIQRTVALRADEVGAIIQRLAPLIASRVLREAAEVCESDAKGPITGDGIVGPLHLLGIAQGLKFAASILRSWAAELETPQEKPK